MASFLQAAKDAAKKAVIEKLPGIIEQNEPMIESSLRTALLKMQPTEAAIFLEHWNKLNGVVQSTLNPSSLGGRKRTKPSKRTRRHTRI